MRILITGKIGSGKSSASSALIHALAPHGYALIDADQIAKSCAATPEYQECALRLFGTLDREAISKGCFANPSALRELEAASLPAWRRMMDDGLAPAKAIIDFPLAVETQFALPKADLIIGIDAPAELRKARATARLGWNTERFDSADALQMGSCSKMSMCDLSFFNDAEPRKIEVLCERLAPQILALDAIHDRVISLIGPLAFKSVARAHCQPHRAYHGATHLSALFKAIDLIAPEYSNDPAIALAILYHDFHYDTGSGYAQNESLSCQALSRDAQAFFPSFLAMPNLESEAGIPTVSLACAMIDATKAHRIIDPWISTHHGRLARTQAFLDADLSILGASSDEAFWAYDEAIGFEFAHVPRPQYHELRAQAMSAFSDPSRGPLYLTPKARAWEGIARARLALLATHHQDLAQEPSKEFP